jgi:hypothetical protein
MAISNVEIRGFDRRLYLLAAIVLPLIILAGFARTYYLKEFFGAPPLPSLLVHVHGLLMSGWVLLFIVQVWFISSKRVKLHQRLGYLGIGLGVLILGVGFFTAVAAAKYGSASAPPDIPRLAFLAVPLGDLLVFAVLFGAAIYYRKKPANHKRLILLTMLNFLPPALGRIAFLQPLGPLAFLGIPVLLALVVFFVDLSMTRRLNKVFLAATIFFIAAEPMRIVVASTDVWMRFATWLTS